MKPTLNETYRDLVKQRTHNNEQLICKKFQNKLKGNRRHTLHTQLKKDSKQLGTPPPKIAEKDQTMPWIARIWLAQLRPGHCPSAKLLLDL